MSVFSSKLMTTKGKELVRQYTPARNAQKIYSELTEHCNKSTKAKAECAEIADFLLNARLENWPGSAFDFIAHLRSQIQSYNEKSSSPYTDEQQRTFLEQAVENVPALSNIETTT